MKNVDAWFAEYEICHKNPTNKLIHWVCIPLIMLSLLGLLWELPLPAMIASAIPQLRWTHIIVVICMCWYLWLSLPLAIGMSFVTALCLASIQWYDYAGMTGVGELSLVIFFLAWCGQFIGHKIEGRKPAFFKDLQFLLIGPLWLMGCIFRWANIRY